MANNIPTLVEQQISPYIPTQFTENIRNNGPMFVTFVQSYYEWLEQKGNVIQVGRSLFEYRDIDTTLDQFLVHWVEKYMSGVPASALANIRLLQKHIKELFSAKGSIQGLQLLFNLLYGQEIAVYQPGNDIFKPSAATWVQPIYVEVTSSSINSQLIGYTVTGRESNASAIVEDFEIRFVNGKQINLLYLSNVRGVFTTGELLLNSIAQNAVNSPSIIGSLSTVLMNESGFNYKVGDILDVTGGSGVGGKVVVSHVSPRNGAVNFKIVNGGTGYPNNNPWAPVTVTVTPVGNTDPGIGATFAIGDLTNTFIITTAVDVIAPYANVNLNSTDYGFPAGENYQTTYTANNINFANGDGTSVSFNITDGNGHDLVLSQLNVASIAIGTTANVVASNTYSIAANGVITFTTAPANSAELFWSGTYVANGSNINTPLDLALNYQNITVGTIASLIDINPGSGYNGPLDITVVCPVIAELNLLDSANTQEGNNAVISANASVGNGAIDTVSILDSGFGYQTGDVVTLTGNNITFVAGGVIELGHMGQAEGYWKNSKSFADVDQYIQDSYYYQDFSYEVQAAISYENYSNLLKNFWHPAGMKSFGRVVIINEVDSGSEITGQLVIQNF